MATTLRHAFDTMPVASRTQRKPIRGTATSGLESTLRQRISSHQIPPGSQLREEELAAEFKVSRAQVREALASLALRGLIERVPNRGAVVCKLDYQRVADIFAVREALEGMCARLAAERTGPQDWAPFTEVLHEQMPRHLADDDFESFLAAYESFRCQIIEKANNRDLAVMLDTIREKIGFLARRIVILPGRAEEALAEHRAVLDALQRGDGATAEALRKQTMRNGMDWFSRYHRFIL